LKDSTFGISGVIVVKITRKYVLYLVVLVLLIALLAPFVIGTVNQIATLAGYGEENYYPAEIYEYTETELESSYIQYENSENSLTVTVDPTQNNYNHMRQIEISERLMYRIEYYSAVALRLQSELLSQSIVLAQRQLEVERVRLMLGETIQGSVELSYAQVHAVTEQQRIADESFSLRAEIVSRRRGHSCFEFIDDFTLPTSSHPRAADLSSLIVGLLGNNVSYGLITRQITESNAILADLTQAGAGFGTIEIIQSEIHILTTEQGFMRSQLEITATAGWITYLDARVQYDLAQAMRPMLTARLDLIAELYAMGEISHIEKLTHELEVLEELFNADMAIIALATVIAELDAMMLGVVI